MFFKPTELTEWTTVTIKTDSPQPNPVYNNQFNLPVGVGTMEKTWTLSEKNIAIIKGLEQLFSGGVISVFWEAFQYKDKITGEMKDSKRTLIKPVGDIMVGAEKTKTGENPYAETPPPQAQAVTEKAPVDWDKRDRSILTGLSLNCASREVASIRKDFKHSMTEDLTVEDLNALNRTRKRIAQDYIALHKELMEESYNQPPF